MGIWVTRITGVGPRVEGSGRVATESRAVRGVTGVSVSGLGRLTIGHADSESLTVTADDNILPYLTSRLDGGRLVLGVKRNARLHPHHEILYALAVRDLAGIEASGATQVEAEGIDREELAVRLSGAGRATVAGRVDRQRLRLSGGSRYLATDLASRVTAARLSGSARARVRVSERLEGRVSGAAGLEYAGDPEVTVAGRATVRRVGE